MKFKNRTSPSLFAIAFASLVFSPFTARAATYTWTKVGTGAANEDWSTAANWSSAPTIGSVGIAADIYNVTPINTGTLNMRIDSGFGSNLGINLNAMNFTGSSPFAGQTNISTNASNFLNFSNNASILSTGGNQYINFQLGVTFNGNATVTLVSAGAFTMSGPITFAGASTFTSAGTSATTLTLSGAITTLTGDLTFTSSNLNNLLAVTGGYANAGFLTTVNGNGATTFSGTAISGTGGVTKSGTGTLRSIVSHSLTGIVTINGGILNITTIANGGANSGIGAGAATADRLLIGNGAVLQFAGTTSQTTNRLFTINGTGGNIDSSGITSQQLSTTVGYSGTGDLAFGGGATTTLALQGNSLQANTFAPQIGNVNTGSGFLTNVVKNGVSQWTLTGVANTYTGVTSVNGGILGAAFLNNGNSVSSIGQSSNVAANLVFNGGTLRHTGAMSSTDRLFTVNNGATLDASGTGALTYSNAGAVTLNGSVPVLLFTGTSALANTFNPIIGNGTSGTTALQKSGTGSWIVAGTNTYTGGTTINGGVLQFNSAGAIGGSGANVTVNAAGTAAFGYSLATSLGRIATASTGAVALGNGITDSAALDFTEFANLSLGATQGGSATYNGTFTPNGTIYRLGGGGGTLSFGTAITSGSLVAGGNRAGLGGIVLLTQTNTFSGGITINAGALQGNANTTTLGTANAVTINAGTLQVNPDTGANGLTVGVLSTAGPAMVTIASTGNAFATQLTAASLARSSNGTVIFNPGSGTINNGSVFTFTAAPATTSGSIVVPWAIGQLTPASTAGDFLTLSGTNLAVAPTYTNIAAGGGGTANVTVFTTNAATTALTADATGNAIRVQSAQILALGTLRTLTLGDTTSSQSGVILNGGTISGSLATGGVVFSPGTAGNVYVSSANGTISAVIAGNSGLTIHGPGSLALNATNTYTGGTFINGTSVTSTSALGPFSSGTVTFNGGGYRVATANGGATVANNIILNGGVVTLFSDTTNSNPFTTYSGIVTGTAGSLVLSGSAGSTGVRFTNASNTFTAPITVTRSFQFASTSDAVLGNAANTITLVHGATLSVAIGNWTSARSIILQGAGTFAFGNAASMNLSGTISGDGGLNIAGGSGNSVTLSGTSTYTGGTAIASGVAVTTASDANFGASGTSLTLGGNTVTYSAGFPAYVSSRPIFLTGGTFTISQLNTNGLTLSGPITEYAYGNVIVSGANSTSLTSATSSYTGVTTVSATVPLTVSTLANGGSPSSIGASTNLASNLIFSGAAGGLIYTGGISSTDRLFTVSATTSISSNGTGTLTFSNPGALVYGGTGNTARAITFTGSSNGVFNPVLGNNGTGANTLIKTGAGTWTITGANTYTGVTSIQNGTLSVASLNSVVGPATNSNLGRPTSAATGTIALGLATTTGTLAHTGAGETTDRIINLAGSTGGGTIDASGTGALVFTSALTAAAGSKTLTLQGSNTAINQLSSSVANAAATALVKDGTGLWNLANLTGSTYTGGTTVTNGTLRVNNTSLSGTGTGNVTVAAAGTLGGNGRINPSVNNSVTINGTVAPGNSVGTLTIVTSGSGATSIPGTYAFELTTAGTGNVALSTGLSSAALGGSGIHDILNVTGALDVTGMTATITADVGSGFDGSLDYSWLIATGTTVTGTPGSVSFAGTGGQFAGAQGTFTLATGSGTNVYINYAVPEPGSILGIAAAGLGIAGWVRRRRNRA